MAGKKMDLGSTGENVAANITRIRESEALNYTELSRRLGVLGREISPLGIRRIEDGTRRVDVDDLMALAIALNVNPNALLLPNYAGESAAGHDVTAMPLGVSGAEIWAWGDGWQALPLYREGAAEIDPSLTGWERGKAVWDKRSVEEGQGFLTRTRPTGESPQRRQFLGVVSKAVSELGQGEWLALWSHGEDRPAVRVGACPEGGWSDMTKFYGRVKAELEGVLRSELSRPFVREVLAKVGIDRGDD